MAANASESAAEQALKSNDAMSHISPFFKVAREVRYLIYRYCVKDRTYVKTTNWGAVKHRARLRYESSDKEDSSREDEEDCSSGDKLGVRVKSRAEAKDEDSTKDQELMAHPYPHLIDTTKICVRTYDLFNVDFYICGKKSAPDSPCWDCSREAQENKDGGKSSHVFDVTILKVSRQIRQEALCTILDTRKLHFDGYATMATSMMSLKWPLEQLRSFSLHFTAVDLQGKSEKQQSSRLALLQQFADRFPSLESLTIVATVWNHHTYRLDKTSCRGVLRIAYLFRRLQLKTGEIRIKWERQARKRSRPFADRLDPAAEEFGADATAILLKNDSALTTSIARDFRD